MALKHKLIFLPLLLTALFSLPVHSARGEVGPVSSAPDDLNQIVLLISPQQVVGGALVGPIQVLLLDEESNLLTDYDLSLNPITLNATSGALTPSVIDDPALFSAGIVNLASLDIRYTGPTGPVTVTASSSALVSTGVLVSFSGYDLLEVVDLAVDTVSAVYADVATRLRAVVRNGGDLVASETPSLKSYFRSAGGSVKVFFEAGSLGQTDIISISLPTDGLVAGTDTLILVVESSYDVEGMTLATGDTLMFPFEVVASTGFSVVPNSVRPDSVYSGVPFDISMAVAVGGLQPPFDSASLAVAILTEADSLLGYAFDGRLDGVAVTSDTLYFDDIAALIDSDLGLAEDVYSIRADFTLFLGGLAFTADNGGDILAILEPVSLTYQTGTLDPTRVTVGEKAYFEFELFLEGTAPVELDRDQSYFVLLSPGFTAGASLDVPGDSLVPGTNLVRTDELIVPSDFPDTALGAQASLTFMHPGAANQLTVVTDFDGQVIKVRALPLLQIIEASIVSPNAPSVNTGQAFQILCRVANLSTTPMDEFELQLTTDGGSLFDSMLTVAGIEGEETAEVFFDVVASSQPNPAEIFRVDIATLNANSLLAVDNVALATVQRPAQLSILTQLVGADEGFVDVGKGFDLLINLTNSGEAGASDGLFRINTNEVYLGLPDGATIIEEVVPVGGVRGISFVAPMFDTVIVIDVDLIERPLDINTGLPALVDDTTFEITLAVTSLDVTLMVELVEVPTNIVTSGEQKELFRILLFNPAVSSVSDLEMESVSLSFFDADGDDLKARSVIEVGSTGLYDHGVKVTRATAGGNRLNLIFDDYILAAGETAELALKAKTLSGGSLDFALSMTAADLVATYAAGPLAGRPVATTTTGEQDLVLDEFFTSVESDLDGSFVVRTNPFNPNEEPAEFRYYLDRADQVRFLILTLSGETVHERTLTIDQPGAMTGENVLFWDGRNDDGFVVVNGVYVAVVSTETTGRRATLKLAVMK